MSKNSLSEEIETIINNMPSGPKMDSLIAWIVDKPTASKNILPYSTDIKYAWKIVEWCMEWGDGDLFLEYWRDGEWFICNTDLFCRHQNNPSTIISARSDNVNEGEELPSFPLAICRYALKCGIKQELISKDKVK